MQTEDGNIRIIDIARLAGVSVGTVDRVIHKRGKVSEENLKKIQAVLNEVNYQPNLIARSLASKKHFNVVAITPSFAPGQYWEAIAEGIDNAANEMKRYNVRISKLFFDQYDKKSFDEIVKNLPNEQVDGVLVATLFTDSVIELSELLHRKEIPFVYVDSNIEHQNQMAYFGTDSYDGGKIAARLLTEKIADGSDILLAKIIRSGDNDSHQGINRKNGFCDYLKEINFRGNVHQIELKTDDESYNIEVLDEVFRQHSNIEGAAMFNSTCYIVGDYLKKKKLSHIKLIGYDLIRRNTDLLSEGFITTLIAQRPESQGYNGIMSICNYLISNQKPNKINLMPIDILIKENIKYWPNQTKASLNPPTRGTCGA